MEAQVGIKRGEQIVRFFENSLVSVTTLSTATVVASILYQSRLDQETYFTALTSSWIAWISAMIGYVLIGKFSKTAKQMRSWADTQWYS